MDAQRTPREAHGGRDRGAWPRARLSLQPHQLSAPRPHNRTAQRTRESRYRTSRPRDAPPRHQRGTKTACRSRPAPRREHKRRVWASARAPDAALCGGVRRYSTASPLDANLETRRVVAPSGAVPVESDVLLSRECGARVKRCPGTDPQPRKFRKQGASRYVARPSYARQAQLAGDGVGRLFSRPQRMRRRRGGRASPEADAPHMHPQRVVRVSCVEQPGERNPLPCRSFRRMELAGLEPATSWVRSRSCFRTNCADLLGVYRLSTRWPVQISVTVCRGLSGVWSAQTRARTSGDVPIMAASPPPRSTDAPRR